MTFKISLKNPSAKAVKILHPSNIQEYYQSTCKKENMQDFTLTSFTIRAYLSVNLEA